MNRAYVFGLIIIAQLVTLCNKKNIAINNELKEWKLQGAVKSLSETDYSKSGIYTTNLQFNPDGYIQEQSAFNPDGSMIRKWEYEYNNRNQKLSRACFVLNDSLSEIFHYSYNESNKITEEILLNPQGKLISKIEHKYDIYKNEIERKYLDENAKVQSRILFRYDKKKNVIEELHSDSVFHQQWKQKNRYTSDGLNVEICFFSMNDSLLKRSTYTYLSNKQVGEAYSYNDQSELISKTIYEYDSKINISSKLVFYPLDNKTEKYTFKYEYDKNKNWTSRYEYVDNELNDIITRKLEYYK